MRIFAAKEGCGPCDCIVILPELLSCLIEKPADRFDAEQLFRLD